MQRAECSQFAQQPAVFAQCVCAQRFARVEELEQGGQHRPTHTQPLVTVFDQNAQLPPTIGSHCRTCQADHTIGDGDHGQVIAGAREHRVQIRRRQVRNRCQPSAVAGLQTAPRMHPKQRLTLGRTDPPDLDDVTSAHFDESMPVW
jgi:hypothetical protein